MNQITAENTKLFFIFPFQFNFLFGLTEPQYMPPIDGYTLPDWFQNLGMYFAISSAASIPLLCVIQLILAPGNTLKEVEEKLGDKLSDFLLK